MAGIVFFIPEDVATTPADGHCFTNSWWTVHPEKGVAFYCSRRRSFDLEPGEQDEPSPQCNRSQHVAEHIQKKIYPDCITKFIPAVFIGPAITEMHRQRKLAREAAVSVSEG